MKTLTIVSMLVAVGSLAFFSCQEKSDGNSHSDHANVRDSSRFEINADSARHYIKAYQDFITDLGGLLSSGDSLPLPNYSEKLVYGANVDFAELRDILNDAHERRVAGSHDSTSLYIMLGLMPHSGTDTTHVIFCLDMIKDGRTVASEFYDFVRPCPTSCPSWMDKLGTIPRKRD